MAYSIHLRDSLLLKICDFPCDPPFNRYDSLETWTWSVLENETLNFEIYPNPGSETLHVVIGENVDEGAILLGKVEYELSVEHLKPGLYFVNLEADSTIESMSKKWMKL
ncbi:MAG: hypothetical protein ACI865_000278 [Flavobacteriaceae bacterium]|jgi:hypothetical protein